MSKPRLYGPFPGGFMEFETQVEHDAFVLSYSPPDAQLIIVVNEMNRERLLCRDLLDLLRITFKQQIQAATMTVTEATDIYNRTSTTFSALNSGWLREARMIANNTVVGGSFTAGRKTFLLAQIDASIAQL